MRFKIFLFIGILFFQLSAYSINQIERVEPAFWWVGMKYSNIQVLVYGDQIAKKEVTVKYKGVQLTKVHQVENPNYLFLDLTIGENAKPGIVNLIFKEKGKKDLVFPYELKQRNTKINIHQGFNQSDVIYLLMPDRFANGNSENDDVPGMLEKSNRKLSLGRHGGDIQGIKDRIPYLKNLGITALWLNPFLENDLDKLTYHGYAMTDLYKTDPRLGNNEDVIGLIDDLHENGLKFIMDMVFNHIGTNHFTIKDLPMNDWMHQHEGFFKSNFRAPVITDPYSSESDTYKMLTGWFDVSMADLNQLNPYVSKYLIQNSIWWVEYSGLDGIRVDTQPYPYKEFMSEWAETLIAEFPQINIVGEAWLQKIPIASYYQKDSKLSGSYNSNMPTITDFPLFNAINAAFNESEGWTEGLAKLYYVLAQDFVYSNPSNLVTFCDNHDVNRYYQSVGHDIRKYKMGLAFLLTTRGIPQIYYGTEILMDGEEHKGHGYIRKDFPGGWEGDEKDAFTKEGRTAEQNEAYDFLSTLLNWRKNKTLIHDGKLKHFVPENGIYVYFRYNDNESVMVILNNLDQSQIVDVSRYNENLSGFSKATDVISQKTFDLKTGIEMEAKSVLVLELN